jgi:cytosine/uracil/thiamine/allantoin permease
MGWAVAASGGSAHFNELAVNTVSGSQLAWGFMKALNTCISNGEPILMNPVWPSDLPI